MSERTFASSCGLGVGRADGARRRDRRRGRDGASGDELADGAGLAALPQAARHSAPPSASATIVRMVGSLSLDLLPSVAGGDDRFPRETVAVAGCDSDRAHHDRRGDAGMPPTTGTSTSTWPRPTTTTRARCSRPRRSTRSSTGSRSSRAADGRSSSRSGPAGSRCPCARRGVPVHGIEMSRAMVARLREKPGADAIGVTIGDMATTRVDGAFSVVYLVFNTIGNLTTQAAQVACFRNAAAHLEPGGTFVIETGRAQPPAPAAGRALRRLRRRRKPLGHRRVRRREPGPDLAPLLARRRWLRALLDAVPVRLARRSST